MTNKYHLPFLAFVLWCFFALNACKDLSPYATDSTRETPPTAVQGKTQSKGIADSLAVPRSEDPFKRRANKHFVHLAEHIPAFGGMYLENRATRLVIGLTRPGPADKTPVEQLVRNYLAREAPIAGSAVEGGVHAMEIVYKDAKYTYAQLKQWRSIINAPVLDLDGITFISLSHKNNQIHIGVEEAGFESKIYALTDKNGVPGDAIKISVTGPILADVAAVSAPKEIAAAGSFQTHTTLRDMVRPLVGGLENNLYDQNGNILRGACTYSFNAYWQTERHWLTNSHCTRQRWQVFPDDEYYQSSIFDGSSAFIGTEVHDPYGWGCGTRFCRYSDAAVLKLPQDPVWNYGEIARTEFAAGPGEGAGSLVIDAGDPKFIIRDEADAADYFEGLWLSKVGRTTGWTIGEILNTCADVNAFDDLLGTITYVCQELTNYHSEGGDSGSPVHASPFGWPDVRLYGIHWGRSRTSIERVFSRLTGVEADLGNLLAAGDEPVISVYIKGPGFIGTTGTYTYEAVTGYENGPVSYQWSINWEGSYSWSNLGTGSTQPVTIYGESDFDLRVDVQDRTHTNAALRSVSVILNEEEEGY